MKLDDAWQSAFRLRDRRLIWEWAADAVTLPPVLTKSGRVDVSTSRQFIAPLDALHSDLVREVNIIAPPRSGKTLVADLFIPWAIACEPQASILFVLQTDEMAGSHAELRTMPILQSVAGIRAMLPSDRHKARNQEILFANGLPLIITGPSISQLQSRGFRIVVVDEAWRIAKDHPGRLMEAKARMGDFVKMQTDKLLVISQGGEAGDDWANQYESGNGHEWGSACASCGVWMPLNFEMKRADGARAGLVWDHQKLTNGRRNIARAIETVRFECPQCGHPHIDGRRTKEEWNRLGQYMSDPNGNPRRASFRWEDVLDVPWQILVEEFLRAQDAYDIGMHTPLIQFYQKRRAMNYDPSRALTVHKLPTVEVTSSASKTWEKQDAIFLTVDVQQDHLWGLVTAWAKTGEMIVLWAGQLYSWQAVAEKQAEFKVPDQCVFVDAGDGLRQAEIFRECARHGSARGTRWLCWWALKGKDTDLFPDGTRKDKTGRPIMLPYSWPAQQGDPCLGMHDGDPLKAALRGKTCPVVHWSNPTIKDVAKVRRDEMERGERSYVAPGDWNDEFARQMHAEAPKQVFNTLGKAVWKWERIGKRPNHLWDCYCMAVVAAWMAGIIGD